jgi:pSer/pThr/pTyr-binding forkhead associated (FHA) protein
MDVIERLNRKFGAWYEGLFGASSDRDLRPRDILHRLISAMEDARREGLDGQVYVPNVYTLQIAVTDDDERDYLRTFLSADDLSAAVQRAIDQHGYRVKGGLSFQIEEVTSPTGVTGVERVQIRPRFDTSVAVPTPPPPIEPPAPVSPQRSPVSTTKPAEPNEEDDEDYEPGTVASMPKQVLASLVVRGGDGHLREVYPIGPQKTVIGRGKRAGNDIVLASDGMVSKCHAVLLYDEGTGRFLVRDEGSTNGTFLNGVRLTSGQPRALEARDQILLGETTLIFRPTEDASVERPPAPVASRPTAVNPFRSPAEQPLMLVTKEGESHLLASDMTIGRSFTSDLVLVGTGVASQHARLFRQAAPNSGGEERFYVEDLGTPGGTFVNGERIPARFPVALYENDEIAFGEVGMRFLRRSAETEGLR